MKNKIFSQDLEKKSPVPGGPFLMQILFKSPVSMPEKEHMVSVLEEHIGKTECFSYDEETAGASFAALEHTAKFKNGEQAPVSLMITGCHDFKGNGFDAFTMSQMWDCQNDKERILKECKYQVIATDMLSAGLSTHERANLDMDFLEALLKIYPTSEAVYFQNCGKLFLTSDIRQIKEEGLKRFIRFGVNVRFFNIQGTDDMIIDTLGMSTLFLPDLQYHFHSMDPNCIVEHAYNVCSYILENDNPIKDNETIDGWENGRISQKLQWVCQYEDALVQPPRPVIDINTGRYAAGER